jgi:hypothetical protein
MSRQPSNAGGLRRLAFTKPANDKRKTNIKQGNPLLRLRGVRHNSYLKYQCMKIDDSIIFSVALANVGTSREIDLPSYIKNKMPELLIYELVHTPGTIYAAAFDWKLVGKISSVLTIASTLWMAYTDLIKPMIPEDSKSGIILKIENVNVTNNYFIGYQIKSEKELLDSITSLLKQSALLNHKTIEEIKQQKKFTNWREVK